MNIAKVNKLRIVDPSASRLYGLFGPVETRQFYEDRAPRHHGETRVQKDRRPMSVKACRPLVKAAMVEGNLRDTGLMAFAQKLEHYEIAAYGTAAALDN